MINKLGMHRNANLREVFWKTGLVSISSPTAPETVWGVVGWIYSKADRKSLERSSEVSSSEWSEAWTPVRWLAEEGRNRKCRNQ